MFVWFIFININTQDPTICTPLQYLRFILYYSGLHIYLYKNKRTEKDV